MSPPSSPPKRFRRFFNHQQKATPPLHTKLIEQIRSGSLAEKELINLYNNAKTRHFPEVMAAAEEQMRARFSRTANKLFGKKQ